VRYEEVYDGIDLVFHSKNGQLEYDFVVASGATTEVGALRFELPGTIVVNARRRDGTPLRRGSIGIVDVYAGSPAARAGLVAGERITAVDSIEAGELGVVALRRRLRDEPGTRVLLTVERAGSSRAVELVLEDLL
jgi:C-terminal processing protease CtpA/Prc